MKVSFYNLGCKVNLADISRIGKQFEELGHNIVDFEEESDIVLINTCTVTHRADADCRKIVRRALKKSPEAFVGVLGCYAQLQPEEIAKIKGVDAVIGQKEKFEVAHIIKKFEKNSTPQILVSELNEIPFHTSAVSDNAGRTRAVLKIQDGCNYHCTFCTIPFARGESRSMEFNQIEAEVRKLSNNGFKEIVLSGINLGDYRSSDGKKFYDVLVLLDSLDIDMRYRISSIEPNLLKDEILHLVAKSNKIVPHFHIPLQSGSAEILRKMKRRYQSKEYASLIYKIKELMPHCCIGADVIVGFPGESDEKFEESYNFINELPISYLHVFTYSERAGTPAITYANKVDNADKKHRTNELRKLSEAKKSEFDQSQLSSIRRVIPEVYNPDNALWKGWTENYVTVYFQADEDLQKSQQSVSLESMANGKVYASLIDSIQSEVAIFKEKVKFIELEVL